MDLRQPIERNRDFVSRFKVTKEENKQRICSTFQEDPQDIYEGPAKPTHIHKHTNSRMHMLPSALSESLLLESLSLSL